MLGYATTKERITEAVARGWCETENEQKEMDSDLANAIVRQVMMELIALRAITI